MAAQLTVHETIEHEVGPLTPPCWTGAYSTRVGVSRGKPPSHTVNAATTCCGDTEHHQTPISGGGARIVHGGSAYVSIFELDRTLLKRMEPPRKAPLGLGSWGRGPHSSALATHVAAIAVKANEAEV